MSINNQLIVISKSKANLHLIIYYIQLQFPVYPIFNRLRKLRISNSLPKMKFKGLSQSINTLQGVELFTITSLIYRLNKQQQAITISHDGLIKIWDIETLKLITSQRIKTGYLMSITTFEQGYIVGVGNGEIIKYNKQLKKQWSKKVHDDCITDILQTQNHLISVGFDGKICFMDKATRQIVQLIDVAVPLLKVIKINDYLYVSGNPSYKVDLSDFTVTQIQRSDQIMEHKGKVVCCSDGKGLEMIGVKQRQLYIPCNFMLSFQNKIITVAEEMIGVVDIETSQDGDQYFTYKCYRAPALLKGYAIKAGIAYKNQILLAGEDGYIYKFQFQL